MTEVSSSYSLLDGTEATFFTACARDFGREVTFLLDEDGDLFPWHNTTQRWVRLPLAPIPVLLISFVHRPLLQRISVNHPIRSISTQYSEPASRRSPYRGTRIDDSWCCGYWCLRPQQRTVTASVYHIPHCTIILDRYRFREVPWLWQALFKATDLLLGSQNNGLSGVRF